MVTHVINTNKSVDLGKVIVQYSDGKEKEKNKPILSENLNVDLTERSVIYKIHGAFDAYDQTGVDSLVIAEEDYFVLLTLLAKEKTIPNVFISHLMNRAFLFLGYCVNDWNFRAVIDVLYRRMPSFKSYKPYVIGSNTSPFEDEYWKYRGTEVFKTQVSQFTENMSEKLGMSLS